jgi:hypothetical protein
LSHSIGNASFQYGHSTIIKLTHVTKNEWNVEWNRMSIVVMQEDENMFVLNLPIVEYLFRSISMWGNIKGASNLEV